MRYRRAAPKTPTLRDKTPVSNIAIRPAGTPDQRQPGKSFDAAGCAACALAARRFSEKHCNFLINTVTRRRADSKRSGELVRASSFRSQRALSGGGSAAIGGASAGRDLR